MTFKEKLVTIFAERSFEVRDGLTKMEVIESTDFEQVAFDVMELLKTDYNFDPEET